ncbi:hypothetical protein [Pseudoalteromonas sp. OF7H-1]|uniref:hypothetical protein n=1 Tax=Pseudoalteromonas sp. OF7H-1 TaxID=2917755 RepID=UPI001EF485F8|nr:hypothetical protein [Pseudoalteromonas sp. OF7H-1]MCG7540174.1 hypothetical protein [Pseudoalteromonas sp. OF7H-1]
MSKLHLFQVKREEYSRLIQVKSTNGKALCCYTRQRLGGRKAKSNADIAHLGDCASIKRRDKWNE